MPSYIHNKPLKVGSSDSPRMVIVPFMVIVSVTVGVALKTPYPQIFVSVSKLAINAWPLPNP
jgi:hypothetical protein